jgi:ubiquinol-cytochrome c reductase cytochrome c1 subunit
MKKTMLAFVLSVLPLAALASGGGAHLLHAPNDLNDAESLKRGSKLFVNYCLNCHSAKYLRYQRMGKDLGISEEELKAEYMFTTDKVGETMNITMNPADGKRWFGVTPPDLSLVARSRGTDWLYSYLLGFYEDPSRPFGVNNTMFKDVGMPHILWELEGGISKAVMKDDGEGHQIIEHLEPANKAKHEEYQKQVTDLVNFLEYAGEPIKMKRLAMGKYVIGFLVFLAILSWILKKEYWRDIK